MASVTASYGSFWHGERRIRLRYGGEKWGNFISVNGLNSGRFLDPPEFAVMHDKGNEENVFDRVDYKFSGRRFNALEPWFHALLVSESQFV